MIDRLRGRSNGGRSNDETPVAGIDVADLAAAVLERSSVLYSLRDHRGLFLAQDPVVARLLGDAGGTVVGKAVRDGVQYLDCDGRRLAILDHPAQVARRTGEAQRNVLFGLLPRNGEEIWLLGDFIPLERGAEGFSVLGVLSNVTSIHRARRAAEASADAYRHVFELATAVAGRALPPEELAESVRPALTALLPDCAIAISMRHDGEMIVHPVVERTGIEPFARRVAMNEHMLRRWHEATHVNQDVQTTDIYGPRVIGADPQPIRSVLIVSVTDRAGERTGSVICYSLTPHAFEPAQVAALEQAGRLIGAALAAAGASAAAA